MSGPENGHYPVRRFTCRGFSVICQTLRRYRQRALSADLTILTPCAVIKKSRPYITAVTHRGAEIVIRKHFVAVCVVMVLAVSFVAQQRVAAFTPTLVGAPLQILTSGSPPNGHIRVPYGTPNPSCYQGFPLIATGGTAPYHWTWTAAPGSSVPAGLQLAACANGQEIIAGVPSATGTYGVVLTVRDSGVPQKSASDAYSITILNTLGLVSQPGKTSNAPTTVGLALPQASPVSTTRTPPPLVTLPGMPRPPQTQPIQVQKGFRIIVTEEPPTGIAGEQYSSGCNGPIPAGPYRGFTLTAIGGVLPYNWGWGAMRGSSVPSGMKIMPCPSILPPPQSSSFPVYSPSATFFGRPTTGGTYNVLVGVTDSTPTQVREVPQEAYAEFTIYVGTPQLFAVISQGNPPTGYVGQRYGPAAVTGCNQGYIVSIDGSGTMPYRWAFSSGVQGRNPHSNDFALIPCSDRINATISGVPTVAGTYTAIVTIVDSARPAHTASKRFTITVLPNP
jgi:hypothetical protein